MSGARPRGRRDGAAAAPGSRRAGRGTGYARGVAHDDDEWPEPERDPARLEEARRRIAASNRALRQRVLRYVYAGLGILLIVVILLATLR